MYGKNINSLIVVQGWHLRDDSYLESTSLIASVCAVAIATAVSQSFEGKSTLRTYCYLTVMRLSCELERNQDMVLRRHPW